MINRGYSRLTARPIGLFRPGHRQKRKPCAAPEAARFGLFVRSLDQAAEAVATTRPVAFAAASLISKGVEGCPPSSPRKKSRYPDIRSKNWDRSASD